MHENTNEGLLVRVEPLERAKEVCEMMIEEVRVIEGALQLNVGPAYAGAIETVLAEKGMRVSELSPSGGLRCTSSPSPK
jgi:hypothetical protein